MRSFGSVPRSRDAIRGVSADLPAEGRINYAICCPNSIRESIDWVWPMYCSIKSEIFGHAYMGMGILRFINASDFSNLPRLRLVRWFTRIALCFI